MNNQTDIKFRLLKKISEIIDHRIEISKAAVNSAKESKNNETKSSAGDKYETGRAMMQQEQEKNEIQLSKNLNLKNLLLQIDLEQDYKTIKFGSLVITNQGKYFIAVGLGKIKIENETYFVISLDSPIGKLLTGKLPGEKVTFRTNQIEIKEIL